MPGADANPYLAYAATIAAGLAGIEEGLDCGKAYKGDAYKDAKLPRVPVQPARLCRCVRRSSLARSAFGQDVVDHYVHLARLEEAAFNAAVTDWERVRYFDRI
jgi:glutamine synthetase